MFLSMTPDLVVWFIPNESWRMCLTGSVSSHMKTHWDLWKILESGIRNALAYCTIFPTLQRFPMEIYCKTSFQSKEKKSLFSGDLSIHKWQMVHWCVLSREREKAGEVKSGLWSSVYLLFLWATVWFWTAISTTGRMKADRSEAGNGLC